MKNKRKHKRRKLNSKVQYSPVDNPEDVNEADAIDISFGGIGIKLSKFLKENSDINLKVIHKGTGVTIDGKGKIVWQKGITESEKRAGIKFIYVGLSELKKILQYIATDDDEEDEIEEDSSK